jgi:protein-arginine kinase activator protein McsA
MTSNPDACTKCGASLQDEEPREHFGEVLCEDCYLEAMSPIRTCDPWAVHTAKTLKDLPGGIALTPRQQQLHDLVKEQGEVPKQEAARVLGISIDELQREFAVLRHLEMLRACKKDEGIFLIPF